VISKLWEKVAELLRTLFGAQRHIVPICEKVTNSLWEHEAFLYAKDSLIKWISICYAEQARNW
jgi:hypothetical protein